MLKKYEKQLRPLYETGMFYYDIKKEFRGNVEKNTFFSIPGLIVNTFGYYQNDDKEWIVFITDEEHGIEIKRKKLLTEDSAIKYLIDLFDSQNFAHYSNAVIDNLVDKKKNIIEYMKNECNYSELKAQKTMDYLMQVKIIAFEFLYFIEKGDYVPDKYASVFSGYTAKKLSTETDLTVLGAFNYMIYLKQKPNEALLNLKKGLPRK